MRQLTAAMRRSASSSKGAPLLLRLHKRAHKRRYFICFGIEGKVPSFEHVDLCTRHVLLVAFRLA